MCVRACVHPQIRMVMVKSNRAHILNTKTLSVVDELSDHSVTYSPRHAGTLEVPRKKLSEELFRQLNGAFFDRETVIACENDSEHIKSRYELENDVNKLVGLSRTLLNEYKGASRTSDSCVNGRSVVGGGAIIGSRACNDRRTLGPIDVWQTVLPPLLYADELQQYSSAIVRDYFETPTKILSPTNEKVLIKPRANKTESHSTVKSSPLSRIIEIRQAKVTKEPRKHPKKHCCINQQDQRVAPQRKDSSSAKNHSGRYYNFETTHPSLELQKTNAIFPKRLHKGTVNNQSLEEIFLEDSIGTVHTVTDENQPNSVRSKQISDDCSVVNKESNSTWHQLLELQTKSSVVALVPVEQSDKPTQTIVSKKDVSISVDLDNT